MHIWCDKWFKKYGDQLNDAMDFIMDYVSEKSNKKYSVMMKEKYGTVRYEHIIDYAGPFESDEMSWDPIEGWKLLAEAIEKATKKWPKLKKELVCDFHNEGFLTPKLQKLHDSMWTRLN